MHAKRSSQTITLTLGQAYSEVSVGIYDSSGVLVRTLQAAQPMTSGQHYLTWDGNTDAGTAATNGPFTAKALTSNATAQWAGVLYSGSSNQAASTTLQGYGGFMGFHAVGSNMLIERTFNERGEYFDKIANNAPNTFAWSGTNSWTNLGTQYIPTAFTSDGTNVYYAFAYSGLGGGYYYNTGIAGYKADESAPLTWSSVSPISGVQVNQNNSGQWLVTGTGSGWASYTPTSLSVQKTGTDLAIGYQGSGTVAFVNKLSGSSSANYTTLTVSNFLGCRWSLDESTLWVILSTNKLVAYKYAAGWSASQVISLPDHPRGLAVDPTTGNIAVACAGTTQQVFVYSPTGSLLSVWGVAGGYANGPSVTDFKWMMAQDSFNAGYGEGLGYDSNGELWINDPGNYRVLRLNLSTGAVDARFSLLSAQYTACIDPVTTSRVMVGMLEFSRNWNVPVTSSGAYSLVNNWAYGQTIANHNGFVNVVTGSNNRVYGVLWLGDSGGGKTLYELTSTGLRSSVTNWSYDYLDQNFTAWSSSVNGSVGTVQSSTFAGFNGSNNPTWNSPTTFCSPPANSLQPFSPGSNALSAVMPWQVTPAGNMVVVSHQNNATVGQYFFGLVKPGGSTYVAQGAIGSTEIPLSAPRQCKVPIGGTYLTAGQWTIDDYTWILIGDEGWQSGEGCQNIIMHSSGLPLLQCGVTNLGGAYYAGGAGRAGNPYGNGMVKDSSGNYHVLMTSESSGGGPQEWVLSNTASTSLTAAPFSGNTASITVSGGSWARGKLVSTFVSTKNTFADSFNRSNGSIGNNWIDASGQWQISSNQAQVKTPNFNTSYSTMLLRSDSQTNTTQTVTIPPSFYIDANLWADTNQHLEAGVWGVVSRKQTSGACYFGQLEWQYNSSALTYSVQAMIGFYDQFGFMWCINQDFMLTAPPNPAHTYSVTLTTQGTYPTTLTCTITDVTTGKPFMIISGVSSEPELQVAGQYGIISGWQNCRVSGYSVKFLP